MKIIRKYINNPLRNFNYLVICEETRQAAAIDPFDADLITALAKEHNANLIKIINTHEHHDHVAGNIALKKTTNSEVLAHYQANVPGQDHGLKEGDNIEIGRLRMTVLYTPGHTQKHICLHMIEQQQHYLFCGDTLFNACAGNCYNGGNVDDMYQSFNQKIQPLPDSTLIYPGHDYMKNNLAFAATREPNNSQIDQYRDQVSTTDADDMPVMTLGEERRYNPFLRLDSKEIKEKLSTEFSDYDGSERDTFRVLRSLRDQW